MNIRALVPVLLALLALPAHAEDTLWEHGRALVLVNCTKCHAIGPEGASPFKAAPPFRDAALNYTPEELVDGFMEGLAVRHQAMPDWQMTEAQAEAITTYIMSLKPGFALAPGSPAAEGFGLVHENCARCHAIGKEGGSPLAKAPPFREVVTRYDPAALQEALAEGIVTGHNEMPEFAFDPEQVTAVIAYLDALKGR